MRVQFLSAYPRSQVLTVIPKRTIKTLSRLESGSEFVGSSPAFVKSYQLTAFKCRKKASHIIFARTEEETGHTAPPPIIINTEEKPLSPREMIDQWTSGIDFSPDTIAIASVYFVQGVLGLSRLAVSFLLKDEFGLEPAERSLFTGITYFPWLIKPLYGFISDSLPLFGYRRRSYLVLCGILGAFSWACLCLIVSDKYTALAMITLSSFSVAVSDVVVDSMVVELARKKEPRHSNSKQSSSSSSDSDSGSLQSLCWGSSSLGAVLSAYYSGSLLQSYGPRFVFGLTAILPLITSAVGFVVSEKRVAGNHYSANSSKNSDRTVAEGEQSLTEADRAPADINKGSADTDRAVAETNGSFRGISREQGVSDRAGSESTAGKMREQLWFLFVTVKKPEIFLPTLFILVWQATPVSDSAMFYFTTNELGFGPEFLGRVQLVTAVASLLGVGVFNFFLKNVPLRKLFFWTTVLGCLLGMSQLILTSGLNRSLGISDQYFAVGDSLVLTVLGQVSFMPILVLAAKLCPPGVEATLFATLMSIFNAAGVLSELISAALTKALGVTATEFGNLSLLIVLCNVSSLLPIPFLGLLPPEASEKEDSGEKDD